MIVIYTIIVFLLGILTGIMLLALCVASKNSRNTIREMYHDIDLL